jgi:hypothetical protein
MAADKARRAQTKRKYIASEAAPSAAYIQKAEAAGEIRPVSSFAKNKLDFSGAAAKAAAAALGAKQPQHIRFDEQGQAEGAAAAAEQTAAEGDAAAGAKASNKSAAQLLRERLMKGGGSSSNAAAADVKEEPAAAAAGDADGTASPPAAVNGAAAAAAAVNGSGEESSATPGEPSPKRARTAEPPEDDGEMADAAAAADGQPDEVSWGCVSVKRLLLAVYMLQSLYNRLLLLRLLL